MANDLTFTQASAILNAIQSQATGTAAIAPVDSASFITSAQTALKTGYDPLMKAISQVLSRTIFSDQSENFARLDRQLHFIKSYYTGEYLCRIF